MNLDFLICLQDICVHAIFVKEVTLKKSWSATVEESLMH